MDHNATPKLIKVLLVDDDEEDYFIIKRLFVLMQGVRCELEWVSSSSTAIEIIREARHDVYLVDYRLDANTGLDILQKADAMSRSEPFILLTGVGDRDIERESLQLAASDYLVKKNLTSDMLGRTLYYALGRKAQEKQKINQLIELNQAKDEFISIASHQLRTPTTTTKQYIAMALDGLGGELTKKQQRFLQKAYNSNERQLALIDSLLQVAQVDAGRMVLALKRVNISKLVHEIFEDFQPAFRRKNQLLKGAIPLAIYVQVDRSTIRMVIENLLENALKYSERGATTQLLVEECSKGVAITVKDEGVGVDEPDRLFEKFSRINNKLSDEVSGTGLGLYWAHSIAELHQGSLRYEKNKPQGSQFILSLPVSKPRQHKK